MPVLVIGYVLCNIKASECSNKVEFQGKKEELFETKSSLALGRCSILKLEAEAIEKHAIYPVFRPLGIIGGFFPFYSSKVIGNKEMMATNVHISIKMNRAKV